MFSAILYSDVGIKNVKGYEIMEILTVVKYLMSLSFVLVTLQMIYYVIRKKQVVKEIYMYLITSFIGSIGLYYNFDFFSYKASLLTIFHLTIPLMLLSKHLNYRQIHIIAFLYLMCIFLLSWSGFFHDSIVYFFGFWILIYLRKTLKELKKNIENSFLNIFLLIVFSYNLFFLGFANHLDLWIHSSYIYVVQFLFWCQLIFLYAFIFYTNVKAQY